MASKNKRCKNLSFHIFFAEWVRGWQRKRCSRSAQVRESLLRLWQRAGTPWSTFVWAHLTCSALWEVSAATRWIFRSAFDSWLAPRALNFWSTLSRWHCSWHATSWAFWGQWSSESAFRPFTLYPYPPPRSESCPHWLCWVNGIILDWSDLRHALWRSWNYLQRLRIASDACATPKVCQFYRRKSHWIHPSSISRQFYQVRQALSALMLA